LVAVLDAARLDLAFVDTRTGAIPEIWRQRAAGRRPRCWAPSRHAFEDLARRVETTCSAVPQGAECHRELLTGLARRRQGLRPAGLGAETVRLWDDDRAVAARPAATAHLRAELVAFFRRGRDRNVGLN